MGSESRTYLDYNASAPLLPVAREAMVDALSMVGNASSVHFEGRSQRKMIEGARSRLASLTGAKQSQIVFTSGASEAANYGLSPILRAGGRDIEVSSLYVAASEHPCVLSGGRFERSQINYLKILESGLIDLNHLEDSLAAHQNQNGAAMVAIMLANNETGAIQPMEEISRITQSHDAFLFVDAVQALGKVPLDMSSLGANFVMFSSHKIGGPQGAGALVLGDPSLTPAPLIQGGGQENYLRGGTENVAAIAGFGAACQWHFDNGQVIGDLAALRDHMESGLKQISLDAGNGIAQPQIFCENVDRLPNTSAFAVKGIEAEMALISLDLDGVSVSSGSACSSGKVKQSHVLGAMGVSEELARCALRVSLGWRSSGKQAENFLASWKKIVENQL